VASLATKLKLRARAAVELCAETHELLDAFWTLGDENLHPFTVTEPGTRFEGVLDVTLEAI
jgi:hypothetical protein